METPKRSAHQIWLEAKEKNLTKEETKKLLVKEGVIVKKSAQNTLYRKVTFRINDKNHDEIWLIGKSANFIFNPNTRNGEELSDFLAGCEEITDTSHKIEKLESDKVLYRKVAVSERLPPPMTDVLIKYRWSDYFEPYHYFDDLHCKDEMLNEVTHWIEEIPDHTAQLKSDKAELLELRSTIEEFRDKANQSADNLHKRGLQSSGMCSQAMETAYNLCLIEIESLIQKTRHNH